MKIELSLLFKTPKISFSFGAKGRCERIMKMMIDNKGKLKIGSEKMDLSPFIHDSIRGSIVKKLDDIISNEDVVIDDKNESEINVSLMSDIKSCELFAKSNKKEPTVVFLLKKKDPNFYLDKDEGLSALLRESTLPAIYKQLKREWIGINKETKDDESSTVMYIPKVAVFLNDEGRLRKEPFKLNVIVIALPSSKNISTEDRDDLSIEEKLGILITDIMTACITCGCKDIIINPFTYKMFKENPTLSADGFMKITKTQKFIEQVSSMTFAIPEDNYYVIMNSAKSRANNNE